MTMGGERPVDPTVYDVMHAQIARYLSELHTAFPGRVESYDADAQTASITPLIKYPTELPDGTFEYDDLPVLSSVPVLFPRSAGWFVAVALEAGDTVMVVVQELSIAAWRESSDGDVSPPGDQRRHHLANCVAIPGLLPTNKKLANAPGAASTTPRLVMGSDAADGMRVTLHSDGSLQITQGATAVFQIDADGTCHAGGAIADQFVALANLVNTNFATVMAIINALTLPVSGATAGPLPAPLPSLPSVAATKAKAT